MNNESYNYTYKYLLKTNEDVYKTLYELKDNFSRERGVPLSINQVINLCIVMTYEKRYKNK